MKRLTLLAVALVMVLGMAVSASAAPEVTISGNILTNAVWKANWDFADSASVSTFDLRQRSDLYFTVTANENLKGVIGLRSVNGHFGQGAGATNNIGNGAWTFGVRDLYVDWNWPGTDVNAKVGVYSVALPAQIGGGSMIMNSRAGAASVSTAFSENVSLAAGFARLFDTAAVAGDTDLQAQTDAYWAALPIALEGMSFTPYFMWAADGLNAATISAVGEEGDGFWIGTDFNLSMFDPFIVKGDFAYGSVSSENESVKAAGYLFDIGVDYTGLDFATVETYFVYTSGENDTAGESERIPFVREDWAIGSFFTGGGLVTGDDIGAGINGFWAIGASLTGIASFAEGLTHEAHLIYFGGTNAEDSAVTYGTDLKKEDRLLEADFNTMYQIYDELTLYTGLSWLNMNLDSDGWAAGQDGGTAYKVQTGIVYQF